MRGPWYWIQAWGGLNPHLPYSKDVVDPKHGDQAKNSRSQKVIFDENRGEHGLWVMPQNFTDKPTLTITRPNA
mgnify:CR=1 FL=1